MNQALYAHINNKRKMIKKNKAHFLREKKRIGLLKSIKTSGAVLFPDFDVHSNDTLLV
jgi:hypothetical protein